MTLVLGIDSSTQSTKAVVVDASTGRVVRTGRAAHPDGTEVHPDAWLDAYHQATRGLLDGVAAVSVAGQQHGMVVLDAAGSVVRPALLWNDTRSAPQAAALVRSRGARFWAEHTGSVPVASFTVTKLAWLAEHEPALADRVRTVLLPHDWLSWRLAEPGTPPFTDRSDASGTGYFSPATGTWLPSVLADALGGREVALPTVLGPSASGGLGAGGWAVGGLAGGPALGGLAGAPAAGVPGGRPMPGAGDGSAPGGAGGGPVAGGSGGAGSASGGLAAGVPITAGAGDNAAAALGLGVRPGDVVVSLGTSGTVFASTAVPTADASGIVAGFCDAAGGHLPLVCTLNAARVLTAAAGLLGVDLDGLSRLALAAPPGAGGLVLLPYLDGERTPDLPTATGSLGGLTRTNLTPANLARAAVEGMLCGLADGVDALRANGVPVHRVLLIGGAATSPAVRAIVATIFGVPVHLPPPAEYVAIGAARQAAWHLSAAAEPPTWPVPTEPATPADESAGPTIRAAYATYRDTVHPT